MPEPVAGLLLAAGAGRRFGGPKALVEYDGEPLVQRAVRSLAEAGCASVRVVVGASAEQVRELLPPDVAAVSAARWQDGMGESLKAGLESLAGERAVSVLVHLVDLPWVAGRGARADSRRGFRGRRRPGCVPGSSRTSGAVRTALVGRDREFGAWGPRGAGLVARAG